MKKILYITLEYPPVINGGSIRAKYQTEELSKEFKLFVLSKKNKTSKIRKNIKVLGVEGRAATLIFPGAGYLLSLITKGYKTIKEEKIDCIFATSPPIVDLFAGYLLSLFTGKKLIVEVRDIWIRNFNFEIDAHKGYIKKDSLTALIARPFLKMIYKKAEKIIVTNPAIKEELIQIHGIDEEKFEVVFNGPDLQSFAKAKTIGLKDNTLLYMGTIYKTRGVLSVLNALPDNANLLVIGSGPGKEELRQRNKNVIIKDEVKHEDVFSYLKSAAILYVGLKPEKLWAYALPSKLLEYLGAEKPILAIGYKNGDMDKFMKKYSLGVFVSSEDPKKINAAIIKLLKNKSYYSNNCRKAALEFSRDKQCKKLLKVCKKI
ncbi:Glycosyl transferases group 1 [Candidatus Tiddalikarchaeum anstoanum]|nr:Glycosyl transferases group 1 [Candidatus Tiddalikarchaeum anstoanum]